MIKKTFKKLGALAHRDISGKGGGTGFEILPGDVFLVSYPKSGNTWVRFILANLMYEDADINFTNIHEYSYWVESTGDTVLKSDLPRIVKSHGLFDPSYPKVVYMVRDGRDVYVSYYNYLKNSLPPGMQFKDFLKEGSMPYGRWCDHIVSWLGSSTEEPLLVISYEELHQDPLKTVRNTAEFIGLETGDDRIKAAIDKSTFNKMKKAETECGRGQYKSGPDVFMRKGRVGDWRSYFGEEEKKIFKEKENHALVMLQYEKDADW